MAGELEGAKSLSGLLSGLAQSAFHGHAGITEELLHGQLYPEVPPEEFRPFLAKMRGILKVQPRPPLGGVRSAARSAPGHTPGKPGETSRRLCVSSRAKFRVFSVPDSCEIDGMQPGRAW